MGAALLTIMLFFYYAQKNKIKKKDFEREPMVE